MPERLLKTYEVADLLGMSRDTILDWFEAGKLPGIKLGGTAVRFRWSEILLWIEEKRG